MARFSLSAARRSLLAAAVIVGGSASLHALPQDQVPPRPYRAVDVSPLGPSTTAPVELPDLTVRIKNVTCVDGHVAVKLRLQDQVGGIGITQPFVTEVKVGGHTAAVASGASPQNPWYNGQEKGANLFPGAGTFQVSAVVDATNVVVEADEGDNLAPSAANTFDANPTPLTVTCDATQSQSAAQGATPKRMRRAKPQAAARHLR